MGRLGINELIDYSNSLPKNNIDKQITELELSFGRAVCGGCGKEFYKNYFVVCGECLTKIGKGARGLSEN